MSPLARLRRQVGAFIDPASRRSAAQERQLGEIRLQLANRYLAGEGIEIGALHKPLPLPSGAAVRYVDRMSVRDLRSHYPELAGWKLVEPHIIDNGETLATVPDDSVDFVIANHFIEHTEDPFGALANHLRVLKPGGVLYMAAPDKRETFDVERELTPLEHLVRDHAEGPQGSRAGHYVEWARHVEKAADPETRGRELDEEDYSIHFHVWTRETFGEFLERAQSELGVPFTVEELVANGYEFIAVIRKHG